MVSIPKLPKKKTRVLAKSEKTGKLTAEIDHKAKTFKNKKQRNVWLLERFEILLSKVEPIKAAAIIATTAIIKQGIEWGEIAVASLFQENSLIRNMLRFLPVLGPLYVELFPNIPEDLVLNAMDTPMAEIMELIISFVVAYIIIEHGDALIAAGGNLLGVAKGLIGALGA